MQAHGTKVSKKVMYLSSPAHLKKNRRGQCGKPASEAVDARSLAYNLPCLGFDAVSICRSESGNIGNYRIRLVMWKFERQLRALLAVT